jgi:hypothetical protein
MKFQEDFIHPLRQVAAFATIADFRRQTLPLSSLTHRLIVSRSLRDCPEFASIQARAATPRHPRGT